MEGFLRKKKNTKNYYAVVEIEDAFGNKKRKEVSTGTDKEKEAKKFLRKLMTDIENGTAGNLEKTKMKDLIEHFLSTKEHELSPNTRQDYRNILLNHVAPVLGDMQVNKVKAIHLQKYYTLKLETLAPNSVNKHHRVLKKLFKTAMQLELITVNPADIVDAPKTEKKNVGQVLSIEEVQQLVEYVHGTILEIPVMLAALCGLRRGEICALKWEDIDFEKGTLTVSKSMCRLESGEWMLKLPKSDTSAREIQIPSVVIKTLKNRKIWTLENKVRYSNCYSNENFVVCNEFGEFYSPDSLSHSFSLALEHAGIRHVRFHDLRHTNATIMLQQGIPMKVASERLGHSTINITADLYTHVTRDLDKEASEKINEVFAEKIL